jgi:hypothetical protein
LQAARGPKLAALHRGTSPLPKNGKKMRSVVPKLTAGYEKGDNTLSGLCYYPAQ